MEENNSEAALVEIMPVEVAPENNDPHYQCDHPKLGRAGTLRIWRFPNGRGVAVTRNFSTGGLSLQETEYKPEAVEINNYTDVGVPLIVANEEALSVLITGIRNKP